MSEATRDRCPACGAPATYVGVREIECATIGCRNRRPPSRGPTGTSVAPGDPEDELAALLYEHAEQGFGFF